ncbi:MAG TPA: bifunctional phosphoribosylaminoimidazolecarboxamide formyltransferase/IMP cyclohydrolase [Miltoncostaeaceae bacterium]|nr:bifunctional phosphoribosylaminoimidazolecarboxamide formyltransferase/IMP cyclohydrolase [Miltoncostaeaceae bacterium]
MKVARALISVSDKSGLREFAQGLADRGVQIISTGGTAAALRKWGIEVTSVSDITQHPEVFGGRVKTLHPKIHGGILARLDVPSDVEEMEQTGIEPIDLVVVNLYPFERYLEQKDVTDAELIEQIDIGGPAMVRAAAKNHGRVAVVTSPEQYGEVLDELVANDGELSLRLRRQLAGAAFSQTARYDAMISGWLNADQGDFPDTLLLAFDKQFDVSYGENPHQRGAYYAERHPRMHLLSQVQKLHGKDLSFNNLYDLEAARALLREFSLPACVIVKHNNPCGVAVAETVRAAYERARDCDPVSAYGGVIVVNRPVDAELGELLAGTFVEVLLAPGYEDAAFAALTRKPNTRIMLSEERRRGNAGERDFRRVAGGVLVQDRDIDTDDRDAMSVVTKRSPTEQEWGDLLFAWRVAKHVKSNAIVLARDLASVGIGAGQMSRVDSVRLALDKAQSPVAGSVLASDAFFPFADGPEAAVKAGITAIIQPGGSIRDEEVFAAADAADVAMVVTGRRHFRH